MEHVKEEVETGLSSPKKRYRRDNDMQTKHAGAVV